MSKNTCSTEQCDSPTLSLGLCTKHYWRQHRAAQKAEEAAYMESRKSMTPEEQSQASYQRNEYLTKARCATCGKLIRSSSSWRLVRRTDIKYCSSACRQKAYRQRKAASQTSETVSGSSPL